MSANSLRVQVSVAGNVRVSLTYPATTTAMLADLIPPDVAAQLPARGIYPQAIARHAVERGYPVGELFTVESPGGKQIRVWLE
jgi:hypothetical protein